MWIKNRKNQKDKINYTRIMFRRHIINMSTCPKKLWTYTFLIKILEVVFEGISDMFLKLS